MPIDKISTIQFNAADGDMSWEWWGSHKHAEFHAGTPFREKSEEAEQGGRK